ncbi:MAG: polymorphic toxin-type HINT domain-containing protein [Planctomycetota bacterium]|jgi:hypothetical protein
MTRVKAKLPLVGTSVLAVVVAMPAILSAVPRAERKRAAFDKVQAALDCEIAGADAHRDKLLEGALKVAPDYAPAHWHSGHVRENGRWLPLDELIEISSEDTRLAEYGRRREQAPETLGGQLVLARWCARHQLADQARAHLTHVLREEPNHVEAHQLLGHRQVNGAWMSQREIAEAQRRADRAASDLKRWLPELEKIRKGLTHRSNRRREAASGRLAAIDDPAAVGAMEASLAGEDEETARRLVEALAEMTCDEASVALARQAVFSPAEPIRALAAEKLKARRLESYVPAVLATMTTPIESQTELVQSVPGRITYRHTLYSEGQDRGQRAVFETEYVGTGAPLGSNDIARRLVPKRVAPMIDANNRATVLDGTVAQQNVVINELNDRLCETLVVATGRPLPSSPEAWWDWWDQYNEMLTDSDKPVDTVSRRDVVRTTEVIRWQRRQEEARRAAARTHYSCLVAGTPVWTATGPMPVEQVKVGDRVLSQDPDTGELALKPVLQTTVRTEPEARLIAFDAGGQTIRATGGHLFWVSGQGWVMARDLLPHVPLHAAAGTARVGPVETAPFEPTHNLVVADFHTYFVGDAKILCHDVTRQGPTQAVVPGLESR